MRTFVEWLLAQYRLETESFLNDPPRLSPEQRKDFARWNAYALEDELHEATQEVAWKPWASTDHFNREAFLREMVDVLFFAGNLILMAAEVDCFDGDDGEADEVAIRMLGAELWEMYQAKVEVNAARMREGYNGKAEKCPRCDRELYDTLDGKLCSEHGYVG